MNLSNSSGRGTHWVAYKKKGPDTNYFDSYGSLPPPAELLRYVCGEGRKIFFNDRRYQDLNSWNCGHLCLAFLLS